MLKQFRAALKLTLIRQSVYVKRRNINFINLADFIT